MTAASAPDLRAAWSLQAVAGALYLLSSAGSVIPFNELDRFKPINGLLASGNLALAVFFTAFGYVMTRRLTADPRTPLIRLLRAWIVLIAPALIAMALLTVAVAGVSRYDSTDVTSNEVTRSSLLHAWSFTQNVWVLDNILIARSDVSSLWVVSLLVQYSVVLGVVAIALRRMPLVLAAVALAAAISAIGWRAHLLEEQTWIYGALDSWGRADAFALGVVAAATHGCLRPGRATAAELIGGATLILGAGALATPFLGVVAIFDALIPIAAVMTALALWSAASDPDSRSLAVETLQRPKLARAGRAALPVIVWSPFFAATVLRHAEGRSLTVLAAVAGVGALAASATTWWLIADGPELARRKWTDHQTRRADGPSDEHQETHEFLR